MTDLITELQHSDAARARAGPAVALGVASRSSLAGTAWLGWTGDSASQGGCVLRGPAIGY